MTPEFVDTEPPEPDEGTAAAAAFAVGVAYAGAALDEVVAGATLDEVVAGAAVDEAFVVCGATTVAS